MTLTLAQAIDIALANNPSTRTAWLQARAAEEQLGAEWAAFLPDVDLTVNAVRSGDVFTAITLSGDAREIFSAQLTEESWRE